MPRFKRKPAQGTAGADPGLPTDDDLFDQCGRVFASGIRQGLVADDEGGCSDYLLNLTWPRQQPRPVAGLADTYVMTICEEPVRSFGLFPQDVVYAGRGSFIDPAEPFRQHGKITPADAWLILTTYTPATGQLRT